MAKSNHNGFNNGTLDHGNAFVSNGMSESEFRDLYKKSFLKVVHYSNQYVNNYELAKEIAQDSFINLWEKRESLSSSKGSIDYYLITIVRNNSFNALRNKMRETNRIGHAVEIDDRINSIALSQDPIDKLTYKELAKIISNTVDQMSHKIRETYLLSREHEMTYPQIAKKLDVSVKTVEYRISKALVMFRISLAKYMPAFIGLLLSHALPIIILFIILNLFVSFNLGGTSILV